MWRVAGSCFRWLSTVQPSMSGKKTSSDTAVGWYSRASASASAPHSHQYLESLVARKIAEHAGIVRVVFDNQQDRIVGLQIVAVVGDLLDRMFRDVGQRHWRRWRWVLSAPPWQRWPGTHIGLRQVQGEGASFTRSATQLDFATQQAGQFAADRQPQARSAVLAAGAGVGLLESLEDDALLVQRNANARIGNFEGYHRCSLSKDRMVLTPAALGYGTPTGARLPVR